MFSNKLRRERVNKYCTGIIRLSVETRGQYTLHLHAWNASIKKRIIYNKERHDIYVCVYINYKYILYKKTTSLGGGWAKKYGFSP